PRRHQAHADGCRPGLAAGRRAAQRLDGGDRGRRDHRRRGDRRGMTRAMPVARTLLGGLRAWTLQRASALYLLGFGIVLAVRMAQSPPRDHAAWAALWGEPAMAAGALLAFASVCLHAWVGARDVILD